MSDKPDHLPDSELVRLINDMAEQPCTETEEQLYAAVYELIMAREVARQAARLLNKLGIPELTGTLTAWDRFWDRPNENSL